MEPSESQFYLCTGQAFLFHFLFLFACSFEKECLPDCSIIDICVLKCTKYGTFHNVYPNFFLYLEQNKNYDNKKKSNYSLSLANLRRLQKCHRYFTRFMFDINTVTVFFLDFQKYKQFIPYIICLLIEVGSILFCLNNFILYFSASMSITSYINSFAVVIANLSVN